VVNPFRLVTIILWALAIVASVLGMGCRENTFAQGFCFAIAFESGAAGCVTLIWSLT
jgi:hypothetical protein